MAKVLREEERLAGGAWHDRGAAAPPKLPPHESTARLPRRARRVLKARGREPPRSETWATAAGGAAQVRAAVVAEGRRARDMAEGRRGGASRSRSPRPASAPSGSGADISAEFHVSVVSSAGSLGVEAGDDTSASESPVPPPPRESAAPVGGSSRPETRDRRQPRDSDAHRSSPERALPSAWAEEGGNSGDPRGGVHEAASGSAASDDVSQDSRPNARGARGGRRTRRSRAHDDRRGGRGRARASPPRGGNPYAASSALQATRVARDRMRLLQRAAAANRDAAAPPRDNTAAREADRTMETVLRRAERREVRRRRRAAVAHRAAAASTMPGLDLRGVAPMTEDGKAPWNPSVKVTPRKDSPRVVVGAETDSNASRSRSASASSRRSARQRRGRRSGRRRDRVAGSASPQRRRRGRRRRGRRRWQGRSASPGLRRSTASLHHRSGSERRSYGSRGGRSRSSSSSSGSTSEVYRSRDRVDPAGAVPSAVERTGRGRTRRSRSPQPRESSSRGAVADVGRWAAEDSLPLAERGRVSIDGTGRVDLASPVRPETAEERDVRLGVRRLIGQLMTSFAGEPAADGGVDRRLRASAGGAVATTEAIAGGESPEGGGEVAEVRDPAPATREDRSGVMAVVDNVGRQAGRMDDLLGVDVGDGAGSAADAIELARRRHQVRLCMRLCCLVCDRD